MDRTVVIKAILGNVLMREIIAIRLDTLWKMLGWAQTDSLPISMKKAPPVNWTTRAPSSFRAAWSIAMDEKPITYSPEPGWDAAIFRRRIRAAMRYDNATLLFRTACAGHKP